jgi:hypothetical protein
MSIVYCEKQLPRFLKNEYAGALKPYVPAEESAPAKTKKTKTAPVVEEPVAEEPAVIETDDSDGAN